MEAFENNLSLIDPDTHHFNVNIDFQSYSIDSFNRDTKISPNSLKIYHNNACSIMSTGKMDQYVTLFKELKISFDILIFDETWLNQHNYSQCNFDGYQNPIHLLRPTDNSDFKSKGGGVSIFVKFNIQYKHRNDLTRMLPHMECSFIEVYFNNMKYLIAGIYRIPNTNIDLFIEDFNALIEPLKTSYKLILLGDYNIDLLKNNSHKNKFEICLQSNYLMPTIFSATRVEFKELENKVTSTETLIDNIFINNNIGYQSGIIETDISDHYSTFIIVPNITLDSQTEPDKVSYRLINQFRKRKFNNDLSKSDIMQVLNNYDAKSACEQFCTNFDREYNQSFPITSKIPSFKDILKPWIDDTAIKRIKIRSNLKKLARKKIIEPKTYRRFRNKVTNELNLAKIKYFEYQFEIYATNIKKNLGCDQQCYKIQKS